MKMAEPFLLETRRRSPEKRDPAVHSLGEQLVQFLAGLAADIDMIVRPEETGFQFPVRSQPQAVAECTELGVVERPDYLDF
jgi:hypothetical protein